MGKKLRKEADRLGFTKLRKTVLYARAKKFRTTFSKYVPDTADAVRDYLTLHDPTLEQARSGGGRNNTWYFLAPQIQAYVEFVDKAAGFVVLNPSNHAIEISIFCDNEEHIRGLANAVNSVWEDGILAHMDWKKITKKFKVSQDEALAEWKKWL